ncbi:hypothetical protein [uncultured Williamsia sp.]|uniref:hypothetical protein n=1 Tax=uncultured Williamsia sp. TaxID=259311 RepID=UPI00260EDB02|nr:hypothetical protein [uncultured Williamsia sp.]
MSDSTWILIACVAFAVAVGVGQYLLDRHRRRAAIAAGELPADDDWGGLGSPEAAARVVLREADDIVTTPRGDHRDALYKSNVVADLFTHVWTQELPLPSHIDRPSTLAAAVPATLRDRVTSKLYGVPGPVTISALVLTGDWFYPPTEPGQPETPSNRELRTRLTKFAHTLDLPADAVTAAYQSARARRLARHELH